MAGIEGFDGSALVPGMLTGFRTWRVSNLRNHAELRSVSYDYTWDVGVNDATCMASKNMRRLNCDNPAHEAKELHVTGHRNDCYLIGRCSGVEGTCGCGFYAFTSDSDQWYAKPVWGPASGQPAHCHGIIDGFGRCVVGPKGFRASHAIIRALVLPIIMPAMPGGDPLLLTQIRDDASAQLAHDYPYARVYRSVQEMRADNPLSTRSLIEGHQP